jgi:hypothetical protein
MLAKATLTPLKANAKPTPDGPVVEVQFNPASLRLAMTNNVEGGEARRRAAQQFQGTASTTLTFDLHFDTADQLSNGKFRSVRKESAIIRQFVLPRQSDPSQPPPRVQFNWGDFLFIGIVTSVTEDIDLFSPGGIPLRSKCSVSMKEQDPRFEGLQSGAGARTNLNASKPGTQPGAAVDNDPGPDPNDPAVPAGTNRTAQAIGGESLADFATRNGLDPTAWRGLASGIDSPLSLPAGKEIDFSSALSSSPGIASGPTAPVGAAATPEVSFGLAPAAGGAAQQGMALSAAGGVGAAIQSVQIAKSADAAAQARDAFAAQPSPAPVAAPVAQPPQARPPLQATGLPGPSAQAAAPSAPPPPLADPRASGFGFGVPLRPTVGRAVRDRAAVVQGWLPPSATATQLPPDPTVPRWALPAPADVAPVATAVSSSRTSGCGCGCGGRCGGAH